jgi:hypothetical protein
MKQVWKYGAKAHGIKKKARKTDWHCTDKNELGGSADLDPAEAKRLAAAWILKNMRETTKAFATATLWTHDEGGLELWQPFNKEHNLIFSFTDPAQ